jgi:hypothetical protein
MDENELNKCLRDPRYLVKKFFQGQSYCLAYANQSCKGDIVRAHTISKKYIKNIAENDQVYLPVNLRYTRNGFYEFKLKNIKSATCMPGFCKHHDSILFKSFENQEFNGSYEQIYAITFRSLCREYYQKKCLLEFFKSISRGDLHAIDKTGYANTEDFRENFRCVQLEVDNHEFLYEKMRKYKKSGLSYLLIKLSKLPLMASGVFFPVLWPNGEEIQEGGRKQLGFICNIVTTGNESYIIISTVKTFYKTHIKYINQLASISGEKLVDCILSFFFFNTDNVIIDPNWFNHLDKEFKNELVTLINLQSGKYWKSPGFYELLFSQFIELDSIKIAKKFG